MTLHPTPLPAIHFAPSTTQTLLNSWVRRHSTTNARLRLSFLPSVHDPRTISNLFYNSHQFTLLIAFTLCNLLPPPSHPSATIVSYILNPYCRLPDAFCLSLSLPPTFPYYVLIIPTSAPYRIFEGPLAIIISDTVTRNLKLFCNMSSLRPSLIHSRSSTKLGFNSPWFRVSFVDSDMRHHGKS